MTPETLRKAAHDAVIHHISPSTAAAAGLQFHELRTFVSNRSNLTDDQVCNLAKVLHVGETR